MTAVREPEVGQVLDPRPVEIDSEMVEHFYDGLALARPAEGAPLPSMLACAADNAFSSQNGYANAFGNLWMRQEWEFRAPLEAGVAYRADARIIDIYTKRDRTVVNTEMQLLDPGDAVAVIARHHQSYLLEQSSGEVTLRDPKRKEGARKFEVPAGESLKDLEATISLEMCGLFFYGRANYHNDKNASAELGFTDVVVGGRMTMSYIGELMERSYGEAWRQSGKMDVKFTNIVWPTEHVTARGVDTGPLEGEPGRRGMFLWLEKDDGTIALLAEASVEA